MSHICWNVNVSHFVNCKNITFHIIILFVTLERIFFSDIMSKCQTSRIITNNWQKSLWTNENFMQIIYMASRYLKLLFHNKIKNFPTNNIEFNVNFISYFKNDIIKTIRNIFNLLRKKMNYAVEVSFSVIKLNFKTQIKVVNFFNCKLTVIWSIQFSIVAKLWWLRVV